MSGIRKPEGDIMLKANYELEILVNGKPLKEYTHEGRVYIEGRKDTEYSIKIKNRSFQRILAVITVDGISVIDGDTGSFESTGYIIDPYSSTTTKGWRYSDDEVAQFKFTDIGESYKGSDGKQTGNKGIIGVAVFREKPSCTYIFTNAGITDYKPWEPEPTINLKFEEGSITTAPMPVDNKTFACNYCCADVSSEKKVEQNIGTGWGETKSSEVTSVAFDRENNVDATLEIYYNTRDRLKEMGIDFGGKPEYIARAFPGNSYCKPPTN